MVRVDDLDRLSKYLAAEILGRHLRDPNGTKTARIREWSTFVAKNADFHDII